MKKYTKWAIIPARSGSKGLPDKNIKVLGGLPLMCHGIKFAINSNQFDKVLVSTDSQQYAEIAKLHGAWVPFLRSEAASSDESMEEDILSDIQIKLISHHIPSPDILVWIRPTFPFRSAKDLTKGINMLTKEVDSIRFVTESDPRIYTIKGEFLYPNFNSRRRSMVRRQEMTKTFNVYHTDIFWYKNLSLGSNFLGDKILPLVINRICSLDIDDISDFNVAEALLESDLEHFREYISIF